MLLLVSASAKVVLVLSTIIGARVDEGGDEDDASPCR